MAISIGSAVPGSVSVVYERVDGRSYVMFRVDPAHHAGAISETAGQQIAKAAGLALRQRVPLIGVISSSGADVFGGVASLHAWGTAARALVACSGIVPIALAVTGPAVS